MSSTVALPPALDGFRRTTFTAGGKTKDVYSIGDGPAVIVIAEMPGITPKVVEFARRVSDLGCTALLPHLFGEPGAPPSGRQMRKTFLQVCISREFTLFALRKTSPVTVWLRALAKSAHEEHGGPGIGVVGMCLTGGFALAMMVDDVVLAPVLSQPSLPAGISASHRADLGISDADLACVRRRCEDESLTVLGLRFTGDKAAPPERFARLREELGDRFVGVEIDSSPGNSEGYRKAAHSVLTEDLRDEPDSATRAALDEVLALFRDKLLTSAG